MSIISGTTYALIIAIEHYHQNRDISQVLFAEKDLIGIKKSLINIGVPNENIKTLLNGEATKSAIETELEFIANKSYKDDRIIFFFAGHGIFIQGENNIVPVDAYKTKLAKTCIEINKILGQLKKSKSKQKILFFDACQSGFVPGEEIRDISKDFAADDLINQFKDEEYCVGFASCKSNEVSISHHKLKHGVWTYYLINALNGNAEKFYKEGLLFSHNLQSYLNKEVAKFVKKYTTDKKDQHPMLFGAQSDKFIIADLRELFLKKESEKTSLDYPISRVYLLQTEEDKIKTLPGFNRKLHFINEYINSHTRSFVKNIGQGLIEDDISSFIQAIRHHLRYKRKDFEADSKGESGLGFIKTPDFKYYITLEQVTIDSYKLTRTLEDISNIDIIENEDFNKVFSDTFNSLHFSFNNNIDIEELIDTIEDLDEDAGISVSYDASNLDSCCLIIDNINITVEIEYNSVTLLSSKKQPPKYLINSYIDFRKAIALNPKLKMLE